MLPPAPGRLSMMTGCPQRLLSSWPIARATMSSGPPAGNGTTKRIALAGYADWAAAAPAPPISTAPSAQRASIAMRLNGVAGIFAVELALERCPHQLAAFAHAALGVDFLALVHRVVDDFLRQRIGFGAAALGQYLEFARALEPVHAVEHFADRRAHAQRAVVAQDQ